MQTKSHRILGVYLAELFLGESSPAERAAFRFGCVEPDWNPATYLKGSLRAQALRGHNFSNARNYIRHLADHLERAPSDGIRYYYRLGKLTHYITDAFTWPHNEGFRGSLREHIRYEAALQADFVRCLFEQGAPEPESGTDSLFDRISREHLEYLNGLPAMERDCRFALTASRMAVIQALSRGTNAAPAVRQQSETAGFLRSGAAGWLERSAADREEETGEERLLWRPLS